MLEVGGGLGVLSEYLAARVGYLHVVEVDRTLERPLAEALAPFANTTLHMADAVALDLTTLDPPPGKVVANLPYGVAATVLLKSIAELPEAGLWVAMVQREVGERLAAAPGSKAYGATSVLAQLACEVQVARRVPRTVFHPEPNVDSVLVLLRRRAPAPPPELTALVHAGFAHRRKALAGSLALVPGAPDGLRDQTRTALTEIGHPADARAERIAPDDWPRLADAIGRERLTNLRPLDPSEPALMEPVHERAFAKLNLVLQVGNPRDDGLHPICSIFASIDLYDDVTSSGRRRTASSAPASTATTSLRRRWPPSAGGCRTSLRCASASRSAFPWRPDWAGAAPTPPPCSGAPTASPATRSTPPSCASWARSSARTSPARSTRATSWSAAWVRSSSRSSCRRLARC